MPDISILMSVKGTAEWLAEAVLSVVVSGVDYELHVRANGPDEHETVMRVAQHVPGNRLYLYLTECTLPLADSLNGMLAHVEGRYVMRLDPDDALPPKTLREMIGAGEQHYNAVVYGSYLDFGGAHRVIHCQQATARALAQHSVGPYNYLVSRHLLMQVSGWHEVGYEDWDLLVRLMAAGGIPIPLHQITLYHRVRADGRLAQMTTQHDQHVRGIRERNREWFEACGVQI